jgi:ribonuclease HI
MHRNVSEPVVGPPTNNVAEIQAATKAIQVAQTCGN